MNSYWGGAAPAIAGALVIGAWRRILNRTDAGAGNSWAFGLGAIIVVLCWPFEGLLLLPQFNFLPLSNKPASYSHSDLEWADKGYLLDAHRSSRSLRFPAARLRDWLKTVQFFLGGWFPIIPLLGLAPRWFRSRKMRIPTGLAILIVAATFLEVGHFPHYAAPFFVVFLILCVQSVRYCLLGATRVPAAVLPGAFFAWTIWHDALLIYRGRTPDRYVAAVGFRSLTERSLLEKNPGKHVIFARYTRFLSPHPEWVYNSAAIDVQQIVWAQDMGDERNLLLIGYYPGRTFWRFEPDEPGRVPEPYHAGAGGF